MKKTAPRLKDVAAVAGVSVMTVSLALRNHTSLPLTTRTRIQKIATKVGYRPDPNIMQLMERVRGKKPTHAGTVLAYLTAHDARQGWKTFPTQRDYHLGAAKRAHELGYQLEEFWLREPNMTEGRLSRILRNRGIEGVVVAPLQSPGELFTQFEWEHFSVVELGYSLRAPILHRCCNQQFQSMMLLLSRVVTAGYRRIGLALAPGQDERVNHHWRAAYLATLSLLPRKTTRNLPMLLGEESGWSRQVFSDWLTTAAPDLVVTVGTDVQSWLKELKVGVPQEVALANADINETMPNVTGINQNALLVGAASIDLLLTLMRTGERGLPTTPRTLMVDGVYVQGATTRVVNAAEVAEAR